MPLEKPFSPMRKSLAAGLASGIIVGTFVGAENMEALPHNLLLQIFPEGNVSHEIFDQIIQTIRTDTAKEAWV